LLGLLVYSAPAVADQESDEDLSIATLPERLRSPTSRFA
jgi:hypothetical protein